MKERQPTPGERETLLAIPETSPTRYISGIVALNILSENGAGDWHQTAVFHEPVVRTPRSFIIERGQDYDPSALLGDIGVIDVAEVLDRMGVPHPDGPVYAADHTRACADLVIGFILREKPADFVVLDDWMPRPEDKEPVFRLLDRARPGLTETQRVLLDDWVRKNLDE